MWNYFWSAKQTTANCKGQAYGERVTPCHRGCCLTGNELGRPEYKSGRWVSFMSWEHCATQEPRASMETRRRLNATLRETLETEMIDEIQSRRAEERVNTVVNRIINYLRANRTSFGRKAERLNFGSYYENLKVSVKVESITNVSVSDFVLHFLVCTDV